MKASVYASLLGVLFSVAATSAFASEYGMSERDRILSALERSRTIKQEVVQSMKAQYQGREAELVGLDRTMDSFEVNEIVAEIIEAESAQ
ncbi:MAG: hypothetical protein KDD25_04765 [Bdellovibrionales bacterium]|nr:hypothetical protein [Bdellovibrionales bacterium]